MTKRRSKADREREKNAILRACDAVGGQTELARQLNLGSQGTVSSWLLRSRIPPHRVLDVEAVSGVSRHELRPDLYPVETKQINNVGATSERGTPMG